jgi:hypothetical protein
VKLALIAIDKIIVCSFFGVILIARPQFLFGGPKDDSSEGMPPKDRTQSVA